MISDTLPQTTSIINSTGGKKNKTRRYQKKRKTKKNKK
jgi:hypothetical protein